MKKFIKYSLYGLIYLFIVFILAIIFMNSAELVKPNNSVEPHQVVKIQLRGLKNNDESKKINVSFFLKSSRSLISEI